MCQNWAIGGDTCRCCIANVMYLIIEMGSASELLDVGLKFTRPSAWQRV